MVLKAIFNNISVISCIHRGRDRMVVDLLPVQSMPITTKVVSLNPVHGEVYSIQHYVIKFDSDFQQVGGFLCEILEFGDLLDPFLKSNSRFFQWPINNPLR
jgi:hypothetical protein